MSIPNGYYAIPGMVAGLYVFNTGVYPANDLEIEYLYSTKNATSSTGYLFGARNQNSNTSAGQYGLMYGSTSYFAYHSARISLGSTVVNNGVCHFHGLNNSMEWLTAETFITKTGATGTFTGTKTIYVGGLDNNGSFAQTLTHAVHGMRIWKNGTLVRDYVPCYHITTGYEGMWDWVNFTFTTTRRPLYSGEVTANDNTGGKGFLITPGGEKTKTIAVTDSTNYVMYFCKVTAEPEDGYEFAYWTDENNNIVSYKQTFQVETGSPKTYTPHFQKITDLDMNMKYQLKVYQYGEASSKHETVEVLSAAVKTDAMQKTTSEFVLDAVPSALLKGSIVSLYSPRGRQLYFGVINSIEGNKITCREPLSIFDQDYVFIPSEVNKNASYNTITGIAMLMQDADYSNFVETGATDTLLQRKMANVIASVSDNLNYGKYRFLSLDHNKNPNSNLPTLSQTETKNLEEYILDLFNDFGVYIENAEYQDDKILFYPFYYKLGNLITISDNSEAITDVNVIYEDQEVNVIMVYNSAGSTLRGIYGAKTDETVQEVTGDYTSFIGYNDYKAKVVLSDEDIINVIAQNLTNSHLNHKITFKVAFGGMFRPEDFYIGRPINFYVGDKLYQSVITSVSFEILENREQIANATITIGKVRTNLTSKINLGKAGKK